MKLVRMVLIVAALLVNMKGRALAWADGGHKVIALLAWERMEPTQREWVVQLLRQHPLWEEHFFKPMDEEIGALADESIQQRWLFSQASVWPDIIRGPRGAKVNPWEQWHRPTWHYIDFPIVTGQPSQPGSAAPSVGSMDWQPGRAGFLEAQNNAVQTLKKAMHEIADPSIPAPQRAVMLCWLFHVLGDVHQPCHCATLFDARTLPTGDRGGNGTVIEGLSSVPLHAYWDNLLGKPGTQFHEATLAARDLAANVPLQKDAWVRSGSLEPMEWVFESNDVARQWVYTPPVLAAVGSTHSSGYEKDGRKFAGVKVKLSDADLAAYQDAASHVARERVVLAALRLSAVLSQAAER